MKIFLPMNITVMISIVVINYPFGFGNDFIRCSYYCYHVIVILCPIVYIHISVTYSYTYTGQCNQYLYKSNNL